MTFMGEGLGPGWIFIDSTLFDDSGFYSFVFRIVNERIVYLYFDSSFALLSSVFSETSTLFLSEFSML
jgi:hypothetical protein